MRMLKYGTGSGDFGFIPYGVLPFTHSLGFGIVRKRIILVGPRFYFFSTSFKTGMKFTVKNSKLNHPQHFYFELYQNERKNYFKKCQTMLNPNPLNNPSPLPNLSKFF